MLNMVGTNEFIIDFECDNPNKIEYKLAGRAIGLKDLSQCESTSDLHKLYFNRKEKADYPIHGFILSHLKVPQHVEKVSHLLLSTPRY